MLETSRSGRYELTLWPFFIKQTLNMYMWFSTPPILGWKKSQTILPDALVRFTIQTGCDRGTDRILWLIVPLNHLQQPRALGKNRV